MKTRPECNHSGAGSGSQGSPEVPPYVSEEAQGRPGSRPAKERQLTQRSYSVLCLPNRGGILLQSLQQYSPSRVQKEEKEAQKPAQCRMMVLQIIGKGWATWLFPASQVMAQEVQGGLEWGIQIKESSISCRSRHWAGSQESQPET